MKLIKRIAIIVALFLSFTHHCNSQITNNVGRYQIHSGRCAVLGEAKMETPALIKIDTVTGQTWLLVTLTEGEGQGIYWREISTHSKPFAISSGDYKSPKLEAIEQFISWMDAHPNGGEMDDGDGGKVWISPSEVKTNRTKLEQRRKELLTRP